jgi:two-component system, cell cycle sensor histidine kinase and response regulator CckA
MHEPAVELEVRLEAERKERERIEGLLAAERKVLDALGRGDPVEAVLLTLVEAIEAQLETALASIVFVEDGRIRSGPAPSLPEALMAALDGQEIGPQAGSCGTAAFTGTTVLVDDVFTDPLWEGYRELAERFGFRACWSVPLRDAEGQVLGTFAVYRTVPSLPDAHALELLERAAQLGALAIERSRMLEALRHSSERLSLIHQRAPMGIVLSRVDDGRVLEANEAWLDMVGYARHEVVGRSSLEVGIWADPNERAEVARQLMDAGEVTRREVRLRTRAGAVLRVEMHVDLVEVDGVTCAVSLQRDVTDERERETQLRRAERLATVGTLVGGVAHELNNPLTAVRGFSELLLAAPGLDAEGRESVELIRREAERMARVVADLRILARESHDGGEGPVRAVDLNDVIRHVTRIRSYTFETHNIALELALDPELPPVMGFRSEFEQVLLNLVTNAEHALVGEGRSDGAVRIRSRLAGDRVRVTVADNGPGIPPEQADRIFDPFFTTKPPGMGTGLGMSLVQKLVQEKGGTVSVRSEPGRGTEVALSFPAAPQAPGSEAATTPVPLTQPGPGPRLKVLVVDDEPGIRALLVRILEREGHAVATASEGQAALDLLASAEESGPFDVVLSDLRMPGLSGPELLERLVARGKAEEKRLLFMTGDAASAAAEATLGAASVPWMLKPFTAKEVVERVQTLAGQGIGSRADGAREG